MARTPGLAETTVFPSGVNESGGLWGYFSISDSGFFPSIHDKVPDLLNLDQSQPFSGCHMYSFIQIKQKHASWCLER